MDQWQALDSQLFVRREKAEGSELTSDFNPKSTNDSYRAA